MFCNGSGIANLKVGMQSMDEDDGGNKLDGFPRLPHCSASAPSLESEKATFAANTGTVTSASGMITTRQE